MKSNDTKKMNSWWRGWWRMIYTVWTVGEIPKIELKDTKVWTVGEIPEARIPYTNTRSKFIMASVYQWICAWVDPPPFPSPLPSLAMAPPFPTHTPVYDKWLLSVLGKSTHKIESLGFNGRWINIFNVWNAIWSICKWDVHNMICWQIQSNMQ